MLFINAPATLCEVPAVEQTKQICLAYILLHVLHLTLAFTKACCTVTDFRMHSDCSRLLCGGKLSIMISLLTLCSIFA